MSYTEYNTFTFDEDGNYVYKTYEANHIIGGDSVSADSIIRLNGGSKTEIKNLFQSVDKNVNGKEYHFPNDQYVLSYDWKRNKTSYQKVKYVMRHKCDKRMFRCYVSNEQSVTVTEDHSLMVYRTASNTKKEELNRINKGEKPPFMEMKPENVGSSLITLSNIPETEYNRQTTQWPEKTYNQYKDRIGHKQRVDGFDFSISPMNKLEEIYDYDDYVYDIEVEETHVFFANDILVHNTDSVFITLSRTFPDIEPESEKMIQYADEIGEMVNQSFADFMTNIFNVPEDRSSIMTTEREVYGDIGYFGSKKRYMVHLVDEEGKKVDKYKIKGLEIIKSDTNDNLRNFLKRLVMMFLNDMPRNEILHEVETFKDWWYKGGLLDIGTPKSVKVLADYERKYEQERSFKGFPQHVKAAIYYNQIRDSKAPKIRSGDKITLSYIKDNKHSNVIAVPSDLDELPDCLNGITLDYDTQWNKVAKKKIENYLIPVGLDFDSYRKAHVRNLFDFG